MAKNKDTWISYLQNVADNKALVGEVNPKYIDQITALNQNFSSLFFTTIPMIYLLDFRSGQYLTMSNGVDAIGFRASEFLEGGIAYTIDHYEQDHLRLYNNEIFPDRLKFLRSIAPEEHSNYIFSYKFRIQNTQKQYVDLWQRNIFIKSDADGNPLLSIGLVIDVRRMYHPLAPVKQVIEKLSESNDTEVVMEKDYFLGEEHQLFSAREKEILKHLAGGFSSKQIAGKLYISEGTVHTHRKNMLQKANMKNVAELIGFAIRHQII